MPVETSLATLLSTLTPTLHTDATFIFLTLPPASPIFHQISLNQIQMLFQEPTKGTTLILDRRVAEHHGFTDKDWTFPSRMITCNVHSSLEAVGFMAKIATALAQVGIGCNPVAGFYHDHLFVPEGEERRAVEVLEGLARKEGREGGS